MKLIANCQEEGCPKDWENLETSGETHISFCTVCFRKVTLVETCDDLEARNAIGERAAIDESVPQRRIDLSSTE